MAQHHRCLRRSHPNCRRLHHHRPPPLRRSPRSSRRSQLRPRCPTSRRDSAYRRCRSRSRPRCRRSPCRRNQLCSRRYFHSCRCSSGRQSPQCRRCRHHSPHYRHHPKSCTPTARRSKRTAHTRAKPEFAFTSRNIESRLRIRQSAAAHSRAGRPCTRCHTARRNVSARGFGFCVLAAPRRHSASSRAEADAARPRREIS